MMLTKRSTEDLRKANTDRDDAIETLDQMLELQLDEGEKPNKSLWNVDDDNPNNNDDNLSVPLDEMFHQLLIQVAMDVIDLNKVEESTLETFPMEVERQALLLLVTNTNVQLDKLIVKLCQVFLQLVRFHLLDKSKVVEHENLTLKVNKQHFHL